MQSEKSKLQRLGCRTLQDGGGNGLGVEVVFDLVAVQSLKANYDLIVFFGMIQIWWIWEPTFYPTFEQASVSLSKFTDELPPSRHTFRLNISFLNRSLDWHGSLLRLNI